MFDPTYSHQNRVYSYTPTFLHAPLGRAHDLHHSAATRIKQISGAKLFPDATPSITLPAALLQRFIVVRGNTPASRPGMSLLNERCTH